MAVTNNKEFTVEFNNCL